MSLPPLTGTLYTQPKMRKLQQVCSHLAIDLIMKPSGVDKGGQGGGLSPPNELKGHPCERMKSEEELRGAAMIMCNHQK